jgi:hypothetical protein
MELENRYYYRKAGNKELESFLAYNGSVIANTDRVVYIYIITTTWRFHVKSNIRFKARLTTRRYQQVLSIG